MAKKNFTLGQPSSAKNESKEAAPQALTLLSKQKEGHADIFEVNQALNQQIVDRFVELFGQKWRYRVIKETLQITGVTLSHGQLNHFTNGKSFHQQNLLALLMVLAHHNDGISIEISKDNAIIIK